MSLIEITCRCQKERFSVFELFKQVFSKGSETEPGRCPVCDGTGTMRYDPVSHFAYPGD